MHKDRTRTILVEACKLTLDKAFDVCRITDDTRVEMRKLKVNDELSAVYKMKVKARARIKITESKDQRPTYRQEEHVLEHVEKTSGATMSSLWKRMAQLQKVQSFC